MFRLFIYIQIVKHKFIFINKNICHIKAKIYEDIQLFDLFLNIKNTIRLDNRDRAPNKKNFHHTY